jgi:hypothetical protein
MTRRDLLRATGLGLAGAGLGSLLGGSQAAAADPESPARPAHFGRAKSVILLHLYGSPSQLEWADMKPRAPVEIRGELGGIPSSLPGCHVCELLPHMAQVMDRTTVIRSMVHPYPIHGVAYALTGVPEIDVAMELSPHDPRHWPFFGSVVEYVDFLKHQQQGPTEPSRVPENIALPFPFSSRRVGEVPRAGPYASFLGSQFNPVWTDLVGEATKGIFKKLGEQTFSDNDPYVGLERDAYFVVPSATALQQGITLDRLNRRRTLLEQFDAARGTTHLAASGAHVASEQGPRADQAHLDRYQEMAFAMLESDALRTSLDLRREEASVRSLYGETLFGQACLAARRLVEAGSRVVTVFWDEYGLAGHAWDTHYDHHRRMRDALCPGLDHAWYGLITDLQRRGMLEDTLVVCTSEHGRTPRFNPSGGRDHWSRAYTSMMAGAGIAQGNIVGATDQHGSDVTDRPVSPKDLQATMYHLLGIDHHTVVHDALTRPLPLVSGEVVREVLA